MTDDERTDADRLELALVEVVAELVPVIGLPPVAAGGPRVAPAGWERPVDPERVPAGALYAASKALDLVALAIGVLQGECDTPVSVEEGLAILARQDGRRSC